MGIILSYGPTMTSARRVVVSILCVAPLLATACGDDSTSAADPAVGATAGVVATTSIWADITSRVGCGEVPVTLLVPAGADAHEFEPSPRDADRLREAALIVANGLGLEGRSADAIDAAAGDGVVVVEVGPQLRPIEAEDGTDPHVWMDPERVADAVPVIAEGLRSVEGLPVDDARIEKCADAYVEELRELSADLAVQFEPLAPNERKLVTNHEALGYLADRFGFEVIGAVIPSTSSLGEPNVRDTDELAATMEEQDVTRIYGEVTGSDELTAALAERVGSGVQVVELFTESLGDAGSGASTYVDMMRTNGDLIAQQ